MEDNSLVSFIPLHLLLPIHAEWFLQKKSIVAHMARVDIIYSLCLLNARSQAIFLGPVVEGDFAISAYLV